jgi:transcriptional regulator of arginine metabolism
MKKIDRQKLMLEIINSNAVETQDELVTGLKQQGIYVTQATVSRDIKELKITKTVIRNGRYAYAAETHHKTPDHQTDYGVPERLLNAFNSGYLGCDVSSNIVVVRTIVGMAPPCALAIDAMQWHEVVGTIAGDDTIFIVTRSLEASLILQNRFNTLKGRGE